MENIIEVKPIQTQDAQEGLKQAAILFEGAEKLEIKSQPQYQRGADILKDIKSAYNLLDAKRKEITKPLDAAKKAVMDLFRKPLTVLAGAESLIKKNMITYTDEQEKLRQEKEEKLRRQAAAEEKKKKDALIKRADKAEAEGNMEKAEELREQAGIVKVEAPVLAPTVEQPKGVAYKDKWTATVQDFSKLPDEYKLPNMPMLNKMAQATKGKVPIAGVVFKSEKIVASRI